MKEGCEAYNCSGKSPHLYRITNKWGQSYTTRICARCVKWFQQNRPECKKVT